MSGKNRYTYETEDLTLVSKFERKNGKRRRKIVRPFENLDKKVVYELVRK